MSNLLQIQEAAISRNIRMLLINICRIGYFVIFLETLDYEVLLLRFKKGSEIKNILRWAFKWDKVGQVFVTYERSEYLDITLPETRTPWLLKHDNYYDFDTYGKVRFDAKLLLK